MFLFFISLVFGIHHAVWLSEANAEPFGKGTAAGEKRTLSIRGIDYTFCWCPPGEFTMGSPESEEGREDDETLHPVTLTCGFWLLESEVTQGMWNSVMGNDRDGDLTEQYGKGGLYPMHSVNWGECQEFCRKLGELTRESVRLPTEAEWEYACRAGTAGSYAGTGILDDMGWHVGNSGGKIHEVKGKEPNAWGLYDMHGNVWEWCSDRYGAYLPDGVETDPQGPSGGSSRVYRGGSWIHNACLCRSAVRFNDEPTFRSFILGFRPAVVPAD